MSRDAAVLLAMVLVGAAVLLSHLSLVLAVLRSPRLPRWTRGLSLLPPLTPVLGWLAGRRAASVLWALLLLAYGVLWRLA